MQREFGRQQWEELRDRIDHWGEGVRTLINCMQSVKQQVAAAAANNAVSGGGMGGSLAGGNSNMSNASPSSGPPPLAVSTSPAGVPLQ